MSFDPFSDDDAWDAVDAGAVLLTYAVTIAEGKVDEVPVKDYKRAHKRLLRDPVARKASPKALAPLTSPELMWGYLRSVATGSGSWHLRRNAAHELIDPILDALNGRARGPADDVVADATQRLNSDSVRDAWDKAIARRDSDPEGAITAARSLLESTIKVILEDRGASYRDRDDLPALYTAVSKELALAPSAHTEQSFKQILGGCHSVVVGLGSLRSKAGDAHGHGRRNYRPAARHATLAVNLAGSMALFLIETHEASHPARAF
jgi:hypothetical protein